MQAGRRGRRGIGWLLGLALAALVASALAAVPERPRFRVIGPAQGLPSTEIKALARDRAGYLWIATGDGLARYDGVEMRVWRAQPGEAGALPGNNLQALAIDADDRVWVAVEGAGVAVLDAARRQFRQLRKERGVALGSDDVWALAAQGRAMWLGSYGGGLTRVDADGRSQRYTTADGLPSDTIVSLGVDRAGVLWVGTDAGLARQQGQRFAAVPLPGAEAPPVVYAVSPQPDGLWIGTGAGIWIHTAQGWRQPSWTAMFQRPNALMAIATDRAGDRWLGSQRGLWWQHGQAPPEPVRGPGPDIPRAVLTVLATPDGAVWAPLVGAGLGYQRSDWRQRAYYAGAQDGLQGGLYRALAPARGGGFWLAGYSGRIERLGRDGQVRALDEDSQLRLATRKPFSVLEDREGRLWLGHRGGLMRIGSDGAIDEWLPKDAQDAVPPGQIDQLAQAADGTLWLSAPGGGVQQRDPASGRVLRDLRAGPDTGLGDADLEALVVGPRGEVWVAGAGGVAGFDPARGRFLPLPVFGGERVYALAFDGPDRVWVQRASGLQGYRRDGGQWRPFARIGSAQGMPALGAAGLRVDAQHRVWISTARGLWRWDPARRLLTREGLHDGVTNEEYQDRAIALDADGVLALATADGGLLLTDTAAADAPAATPALRLDRFAVRRDGHWQELAADAPRLRADDRELRIGARLLAFQDPPSNRYWSRLDGFDAGWVAMEGNGDRVFTGLAPGHYVLRMRARDADGNPAREQQLAFRVPPPWWRTPWAWLAYLLAAAGLLLWAAHAYRERLRRRHAWQMAEQKREMAEQASQAKSRFLATLGHEVRTPMTGVLGMTELLAATPLDAGQRRHVEAIRHAGEHLLRLVNDALDLARIEAGKLELADEPFPLQGVLDDVAGLMGPLAEHKGLHFRLQVAAEAPAVLRGDRTRVLQILLNLLGNAIKFTEQGAVGLEVAALAPHGVRLQVSDTGPGLNAEQRARLFRRFEQAEGVRTASRYGGSGLGLAISQELAAAMGGRITVDSAPGQGTRFTVELPLAQAAPAASVQAPAAEALPGQRLLLVEDDAIVAETLAVLLRAQGHAVTHVAHGLAALAEVASGRFDAALLDLDLPGMDGLALARMLRAQGFAAPLLAVTARADAAAEGQALAAGFDAFLRKPVGGAALAQALRRAFAARAGAAPA